MNNAWINNSFVILLNSDR